MNKWKIAFWICFALMIATIVLGTYTILDQGVSLTYMREGYEDTENDLNTLIELINDTDLTREQVKQKLKKHELFEYMDFSQDTIHVHRLSLVFEGDRLDKLQKQW